MTFTDALGWAASLMTLVTFAQRQMVPLRVTAILANLFFIGYASLGHYLPVLVLHLTLLPVNGQRLTALLVERSKAPGLGSGGAQTLKSIQLLTANLLRGFATWKPSRS
jgi:hypothetical protein